MGLVGEPGASAAIPLNDNAANAKPAINGMKGFDVPANQADRRPGWGEGPDRVVEFQMIFLTVHIRGARQRVQAQILARGDPDPQRETCPETLHAVTGW